MTAGDAFFVIAAIGLGSLSVLFFGIGMWTTYHAGNGTLQPSTQGERE